MGIPKFHKVELLEMLVVDKSTKIILILALAAAMAAVVLGAFGAHALKATLSVKMMAVYQTGITYQFYHALAMLSVVSLQLNFTGKSILLLLSGACFFCGILLFSGSLYLLALSGAVWLGPITPIGGVCFILGWLLFVVAIVKEVKVDAC